MPPKTKHARLKRRTPSPAVAGPPARGTSRADEERTWVALPDPCAEMSEPLYVSFPAPPDAEALEEARCHLAALEANRQIARDDTKGSRSATHAIEVDARGHRRLVRKRLRAR